MTSNEPESCQKCGCSATIETKVKLTFGDQWMIRMSEISRIETAQKILRMQTERQDQDRLEIARAQLIQSLQCGQHNGQQQQGPQPEQQVPQAEPVQQAPQPELVQQAPQPEPEQQVPQPELEQQVPQPEPVQQAPQSSSDVKFRVKMQYAYNKNEDDEISVSADEIIGVIDQYEGCGWWLGESADGTRRGLFPGNVVCIIDPRFALDNLSKSHLVANEFFHCNV